VVAADPEGFPVLHHSHIWLSGRLVTTKFVALVSDVCKSKFQRRAALRPMQQIWDWSMPVKTVKFQAIRVVCLLGNEPFRSTEFITNA